MSIGLCMIVRDESAVVERCLASVRHLVDSWVICDTGSSDGTPELVERALRGIPGTLHHVEWVDFADARSELMKRARGSADYLLLLDADMTVVQRGPLAELTADAYYLRETGPLDFGVIRLVRGDRHWWYEGSTHEYIATDGTYDHAQLDALLVEHHADGSARPQKLLRDVGLLKRDLLRDPLSARAAFYLAQTYRALGKNDLAIDWYARRVELRGWDEEVFYARLQEGILRLARDGIDAVPVLLDAWQRRPTRAEPLYELVRFYREREEWHLAELYAKQGLAIPYPSDTLFVHRAVYQWALAYEHALAVAAIGGLDEAERELTDLLDTPDVPLEVQEAVEHRLDDLATRRSHTRASRGDPPRLAALAPSLRIGEIRLDVQPAWPCFNPSIAPDGDGFRMIVRSANYRIERGVVHADGVLQNINYIVHLDGNLAVTGIEPITDSTTNVRRYHSQVQGYEDCRLIEVQGRWWATATVSELNPVERREVALLELDGAEIVDVAPLMGPTPGRHEKNWMPFVTGGELHVVYSCGPTTILRCDLDSLGHTHLAAQHHAMPEAKGFRGGSQGVEVADGFLFAVHGVDRSESRLRYVHRFVLVDRELRLAAASDPFTFTSDRVEFCAGMALRGDELVLSFGVSDAASGLGVLRLEEALALLQPSS